MKAPIRKRSGSGSKMFEGSDFEVERECMMTAGVFLCE